MDCVSMAASLIPSEATALHMKRANEARAVDAPIPLVLAIVCRLRRATDQQRWTATQEDSQVSDL